MVDVSFLIMIRSKVKYFFLKFPHTLKTSENRKKNRRQSVSSDRYKIKSRVIGRGGYWVVVLCCTGLLNKK